MSARPFDLLVIGEGIAGLTAAGIAARAGLRVASFEGSLAGGLVGNIVELDPAPGGVPASGADLAGELILANAKAGVVRIDASVLLLHAEAPDRLRLVTAVGSYEAPAVIVASGARLRALEVPNEAAYRGRGLSTCADCDGPLFQGQDVVVVGGGDSALQQALTLASICARVVIVHDRDSLVACLPLVERVLATPTIHVIAQSRVVALEGDEGLEAVHVRSNDAATSTRIACQGIFPFVGLLPATEFLPAEVVRNHLGAVEVRPTCETSVPNLWAIGAARASFPGRLEHAIADAEVAVRELLGRRMSAGRDHDHKRLL